MTRKMGTWRWYCGNDVDDDEMCDCEGRDQAIAYGLRETPLGESFWIVEARMLDAHEKAMGDGKRYTAPFAETRHGEFIENALPTAIEL